MATTRPALTPRTAEQVDKELIERLEAKRVLPVKQVARILGISVRTVWNLIDAGTLLATNPSDGRVGVRQDILLRYIDEKTPGVDADSA